MTVAKPDAAYSSAAGCFRPEESGFRLGDR